MILYKISEEKQVKLTSLLLLAFCQVSKVQTEYGRVTLFRVKEEPY